MNGEGCQLAAAAFVRICARSEEICNSRRGNIGLGQVEPVRDVRQPQAAARLSQALFVPSCFFVGLLCLSIALVCGHESSRFDLVQWKYGDHTQGTCRALCPSDTPRVWKPSTRRNWFWKGLSLQRVVRSERCSLPLFAPCSP